MDSYEIAKQILQIYSEHANKSSGQMNKDEMTIPLYFNTDNEMHRIYDVFYIENFGIVLR